MKAKNDCLKGAMLTTGEVARIFGVHPSTIRRWSTQGIIQTRRSGQCDERGFRREDVAAAYLYRAIQGYLGRELI